MFEFFSKKYTFNDIPLSDINDLKKRIKIVVIDDNKDSFPIEQCKTLVLHWNIGK